MNPPCAILPLVFSNHAPIQNILDWFLIHCRRFNCIMYFFLIYKVNNRIYSYRGLRYINVNDYYYYYYYYSYYY